MALLDPAVRYNPEPSTDHWPDTPPGDESLLAVDDLERVAATLASRQVASPATSPGNPASNGGDER